MCERNNCTVYLRFVTTRIDIDSHRPEGIFMAAYRLLRSGDLTPEEWNQLRGMLDWFNEHLPHPPSSFEAGRAIFWFRSSAQENIRQVWALIYVLRDYGYQVEVHACRHLRNIKYSDDFQVCAYPSDLDGKTTIR
jgi:hypothetical protein